MHQARIQPLRITRRAKRLRQLRQPGELGRALLFLVIQQGVVDGDRRLPRDQVQQFHIALLISLRIERTQFQRTDGFLAHDQRHANVRAHRHRAAIQRRMDIMPAVYIRDQQRLTVLEDIPAVAIFAAIAYRRLLQAALKPRDAQHAVRHQHFALGFPQANLDDIRRDEFIQPVHDGDQRILQIQAGGHRLDQFGKALQNGG